MTISVFDRIETIVGKGENASIWGKKKLWGKGENAGYHNSFPHNSFQKLLFQGRLKLGLFGKGLIH